jgi:hypothetical protein
MKQYVCIKEYVTEEGDVAYRLGKIYELEKHKMLASEISGVKYYFSSDFKKTYFKKHKPMTSFGGNGLFDSTTCVPTANGIWTGRIITKDVVDRINSTWNITTTNPTNNGVWVDEFTKFTEKDSVVEAVVKKFQDRSRVGIEKYGTTLDRTDIDFDGWAEHLQQELMDAILYLERLKKC